MTVDLRHAALAVALAGCGVSFDDDAPASTDSSTAASLGGGTLVPSGPYTDWSFASDLYNLDARVTITSSLAADDTEFWATQFYFRNGDGGYMGLQNAGEVPSGGSGKIAIASIWQATGATAYGGATCMPFEEGGSGYTCRLAYDWVPGHTYRMRAWIVGTGQWLFAVADLQTGAEIPFGVITVPSAWGNISGDWVGNWTEYFASNSPDGLLRKCTDLPVASALFQLSGQGDSVSPSLLSGHVADADCHNTRVDLVSSTIVSQVYGGQDNGWLSAGQSLRPGQAIWSQDNRNMFVNQTDGNVVLYHDGRALWASRTNSSTPGTLFMQTDGNLVLYRPDGVPVWWTGTQGQITSLTVQSDCNVVLYRNGSAVWHTQTYGCRSRL